MSPAPPSRQDQLLQNTRPGPGDHQLSEQERQELADETLQAKYRTAYLEQLRRRACPGCGEREVLVVREPVSLAATLRQLNLNDLAQAHRRSDAELDRLAAPILADLRTIEAVTGVDAAGIARRGALVFEPYLEGRDIASLAAAYVVLRRAGAQSALIDRFEFARGVA